MRHASSWLLKNRTIRVYSELYAAACLIQIRSCFPFDYFCCHKFWCIGLMTDYRKLFFTNCWDPDDVAIGILYSVIMCSASGACYEFRFSKLPQTNASVFLTITSYTVWGREDREFNAVDQKNKFRLLVIGVWKTFCFLHAAHDYVSEFIDARGNQCSAL